jgi:hypothetical protein
MILISSILSMIGPVAMSRNGMIAIGVSVAMAIVGIWDHRRAERHRSEGAARVVRESNDKARDNARKASDAHARARKPGAADRLRREYGQ